MRARRTRRRIVAWPAGLALLLPLVSGCTHRVEIEPIKVEPIHLTIDVNVKVDRALEDFFDFEDPLQDDPGTEGGTT